MPRTAPVKGKVVQGMAQYFTEVKHLKLGRSGIDFLLLNIPPVCNYRCKKCFTSASLRTMRNPLTLPEWRYLIREGKKLGAKNVSILGEGEPLIYPTIRDILGYIHRQRMVPMIATNARMLTRSTVDFLYANNVTVGFSLDTLNRREYNSFCGGNADLAAVLRNIAYARTVFSRGIRTERGYRVYRFVLHMTVTPKNYHRLSQLREFCGDDIFFDCQPLANVGVAEDHGKFFGSEMSYRQFQQYGHTVHRPMVLSQTERHRPICCLFYYGLAVNYAGDVMFDTHAIEPQRYIGNIRDYPLPELLARVQRLRQHFLNHYQSGYCPVRDRSYQKFLASIKSKRKAFLWN
jgi:MoaA/NifB/PqqE/SkfB family radical SAM enzyme